MSNYLEEKLKQFFTERKHKYPYQVNVVHGCVRPENIKTESNFIAVPFRKFGYTIYGFETLKALKEFKNFPSVIEFNLNLNLLNT